MPTSHYTDRLSPTTGEVRFLLDLEIAGHVFRVADAPAEVEHEDGTTLVYREGLAVDYDVAMTALGDSGGEESIQVSLVLAGVDFAELAAAGHDLAAGTGQLSRWVEGTTYGERQLLLDGAVSEPTYGAEGEEFSFSLASLPVEDRASWPPADAVVDSTTWPKAHENTEGARYPWILGCPGWVDAGEASKRTPGSPALLVDVTADTWLIAGHSVRATHVWWTNKGDPYSPFQLAVVAHLTDGRGRRIAYITGLEATLDPDYERDVWVSWAPLACGILRVPAQAALLDNETFTISDGASTFVFEFNVSGAAVIGGGNVEVDVSGDTTPAEVVDTIVEAVTGQGTLLGRPGLFASALFADVYVVNQSPGAGARNTVITETVASGTFAVIYGMHGGLDEDERGGITGNNGQRTIEGAGDLLAYMLSRSTLSVDTAEVAGVRRQLNEVARVAAYVDEQVKPLEWLRSHLLEIVPLALVMGPEGVRPVLWDSRQITAADAGTELDADLFDVERVGPVEVGGDDDVVNSVTLQWGLNAAKDEYRHTTAISGASSSNAQCRASHIRYGERSRTLESDIIFDSDTAARVVAWITSAYSSPSHRVTYSAPRSRVLHLLPGDLVTVVDSELHWNGKPFRVVEVRDEGSGDLELTLQSIEDPAWT
jgi:hypothetical protein